MSLSRHKLFSIASYFSILFGNDTTSFGGRHTPHPSLADISLTRFAPSFLSRELLAGVHACSARQTRTDAVDTRPDNGDSVDVEPPGRAGETARTPQSPGSFGDAGDEEGVSTRRPCRCQASGPHGRRRKRRTGIGDEEVGGAAPRADPRNPARGARRS